MGIEHNETHSGLCRALICEGISVEVYRAREVHRLHTSEFDSRGNSLTETDSSSKGIVKLLRRSVIMVEKLWFEVVARVDKDTLKPLVVNKVQPFAAVDTAALSSLLFNIYFTSILVPEALTLDVKW
ncbi:hypothetical protein MLD38_022291 [Melastoma candidum]|uniref:Uncharacterized protein n=1 Tax=Melastoma candidum TaxID=119954 RepID=A0ACB9QM69_9MYRT|nr:hypothetical protein MLD38_022291 [Melastoma candidum]